MRRLAVLLLLAACHREPVASPGPVDTKPQGGFIPCEKEGVVFTDKEAIEVARKAIEGKVTLSATARPVVKRDKNDYIVTFERKNPPNFLGPDYDARVTIDCNTRQVKQILGGD